MGKLMDMLDPLSGIADIATAGYNVWSQERNRNDQLDLQKQSWAREDNATQRRVADLTAAGLSPTLAAGSAASTSSPINLQAPQANFDLQQKRINSRNLLQQKKQIAQTMAQTQLLKDQAEQAKSNTALINTNQAIKQHDLDVLTSDGRENYTSDQKGAGPNLISGTKTVLDAIEKTLPMLHGQRNSIADQNFQNLIPDKWNRTQKIPTSTIQKIINDYKNKPHVFFCKVC